MEELAVSDLTLAHLGFFVLSQCEHKLDQKSNVMYLFFLCADQMNQTTDVKATIPCGKRNTSKYIYKNI